MAFGDEPGYGVTFSKPGIDPMTGLPIPDPAAMLKANAASSPYAAMQASTAANAAASGQGQDAFTEFGGGVHSGQFFSQANAPMAASGGILGTPVGGYNTGVIQQLMRSLSGAQAQQQAAAQQQYQQLLGTVSKTGKAVTGLQKGLGATGMARIAQQEQQARGAAEQQMTSRGLGNTTLLQAAERGVARDAEQARQSLQEGIAQQKIGTTMQLGNMYGDALLSRVNQPPQMGMYLQLIQALAGGR